VDQTISQAGDENRGMTGDSRAEIVEKKFKRFRTNEMAKKV